MGRPTTTCVIVVAACPTAGYLGNGPPPLSARTVATVLRTVASVSVAAKSRDRILR